MRVRGAPDAKTLVPLGRTLPLIGDVTSADGGGAATSPIACSLEPDAVD